MFLVIRKPESIALNKNDYIPGTGRVVGRALQWVRVDDEFNSKITWSERCKLFTLGNAVLCKTGDEAKDYKFIPHNVLCGPYKSGHHGLNAAHVAMAIHTYPYLPTPNSSSSAKPTPPVIPQRAVRFLEAVRFIDGRQFTTPDPVYQDIYIDASGIVVLRTHDGDIEDAGTVEEVDWYSQNGNKVQVAKPGAQCECGAHKTKSKLHSTWCPLHGKEK